MISQPEDSRFFFWRAARLLNSRDSEGWSGRKSTPEIQTQRDSLGQTAAGVGWAERIGRQRRSMCYLSAAAGVGWAERIGRQRGPMRYLGAAAGVGRTERIGGQRRSMCYLSAAA